MLSVAVETARPDVLGEPVPFIQAEREACRGVLGVPDGYRLAVQSCDLDATVAGASGTPSPSGGRCPVERTHAGSCLESCIARGRAAGARHKVTRSQKTPDHLRSVRCAGDRSDEVGAEFRLGEQRAESGVDPARPPRRPTVPSPGGGRALAASHRRKSNSPFLARPTKSRHSPWENDRTGLCVPCLASRAPMEWDEPSSVATSTHVLLAPQWALLLHCGAGVAKGDTRCLSQGLSPFAGLHQASLASVMRRRDPVASKAWAARLV